MSTNADLAQPLQTAQMTVQQSRYRTALVTDIVNRLEFLGPTRPRRGSQGRKGGIWGMKPFSLRCVLRLHSWRIDQYRHFMPFRRTCKHCGRKEVFIFGSWEEEPP